MHMVEQKIRIIIASWITRSRPAKKKITSSLQNQIIICVIHIEQQRCRGDEDATEKMNYKSAFEALTEHSPERSQSTNSAMRNTNNTDMQKKTKSDVRGLMSTNLVRSA